MTFQLGEWTVNEATSELIRSDEKRRLEARTMRLLSYLYENRGQLVSKDELVDTVWQLQAVTDHSITVAISDLRRALGDSAKSPRFIETIPKKGYRLIDGCELSSSSNATGSQVDNPQDSTASIRRWVPAIVILLVAALLWFVVKPDAPGQRMLVVYDAENRTGVPSNDSLAASLTELVIDNLARVQNLNLVRFRPSKEPINSWPTGVHVLTPSLVRGEDSLLFSMSLMSSTDGKIVWNSTHAVSEDHFIYAEVEALKGLASHMGFELSQHRQPEFPANLEEAYWRARHLWSLRNRAAVHEARGLLLNILEGEPDFWPAHAALADIYAHKTGVFFRGDDVDTEALAGLHLLEAEKAAPRTPETLSAKAHHALFIDIEPGVAVEYLQTAVKAAPNNAALLTSLATAIAAEGRFEAAVDVIREASKRDPNDPLLMMDKVWVLFVAGEYEAAVTAADEARDYGMSSELYRGMALSAARNHEQALLSWFDYLDQQGVKPERIRELEKLADAGQGPQDFASLYGQIAAELPNNSTLLIAMLNGFAGNHEQVQQILRTTNPADVKWVRLWGHLVPGLKERSVR